MGAGADSLAPNFIATEGFSDLRIPYTDAMTVAREASLTNRIPKADLADAETLEMIYRAEEDPLRKAQIRKQLEEMRKQVETR